MAYDEQGKWQYEDDSVANRIAKITAGDSSFMRQARTAGKKLANRRGLGNSSMAVQASQAAALDRAAPIASQEASQIAQKNIGEQNFRNEFDRDAARYAAAEREMRARAMVDLTGQRYNAFANTLTNADIPADVRSAVQRSINDQHDGALLYLERLYGTSVAPNPTPMPSSPGGNGQQLPQPIPYPRYVPAISYGLGGSA